MNQIVLNGLISGFSYALIGLSVSLIYAPTRFFHFAHGAVYAWAAYFAYIFAMTLNLSLWLALPIAISLATLLGSGLEICVYRPLRCRGAGALVLLLASLGLYVVLQNVISLLFGDAPLHLHMGEVKEGIILFGARVTTIQLWTVVAAILSFALAGVMLRFSRFGKMMRAVAADPELSWAYGISTDRVIFGAFALGSGLAGLAASLVALDVAITPTIGLNAMMTGVVAMIVGGVGSIPGVLLAGILLGLAQNIGAWQFGSQWQDTIVFVVLIGFLIWRRQGLFGTVVRKAAV